jgi:hypothetical protein
VEISVLGLEPGAQRENTRLCASRITTTACSGKQRGLPSCFAAGKSGSMSAHSASVMSLA